MRQDDEIMLAALVSEFLGEQRDRVIKDPDWALENIKLALVIYPVLEHIMKREADKELKRLHGK